MDFQTKQQLILSIGVVLFLFIYRRLRGAIVKKQLPLWLNQGGIIVDVRSRNEFQTAANPKSKNIPLGELDSGIAQFSKETPIVLCCASGTRSGIALRKLKQLGYLKLMNAGSWRSTLVQ